MNKLFVLMLFLATTLSFAQEKITWVSLQEAEKIQAKNPEKPMFIDVYTDWCGWCKKMDKSTFMDKEVVKYLNNNFIPVKFDAEQKGDIKFKDRTFKFIKAGNNGYHQLAAVMLQGQMSYPSYLVLENDGNVTNVIRGFQKPNVLLDLLKE